MTGHMNGHHALQALKPLEVASYLRVQGWRQDADLNGKGSLWLLGPGNGHDEADVTLPLRRDLGDFELRMSEVVRTLGRVEKRPEAEILQDLLTIPQQHHSVQKAPAMSDEDRVAKLLENLQRDTTYMVRHMIRMEQRLADLKLHAIALRDDIAKLIKNEKS
jgi:hypothetical protein